MKKISTLVSILSFAANVFAQNVGINNTNPQVSLDVQGAIATRAVTLTPFLNGVNIPDNASFVIIGPGTGVVTAYPSGTFTDGQRMTVYNSGGYNLIVQILAPGNATIPPNEARDFICRVPGGWSLTSATAQANVWNLTGNAGTTSSNFIGTLSLAPLLFKIDNADAGGIGRYGNVILGNERENNIFFSETFVGSTGNTAIGNKAMRNNSIMGENTVVGYAAAENNINGNRNVAMGHLALRNNKNGNYAVAIGKDALLNDTAAQETVAVGGNALYWNNNKFGNTAVGTNSLFNNSFGTTTATQGIHNTALGHSALFSNRRGSGAVAIGSGAAYRDTAANGIIAIGRAALYNNNGREGNTAIGDSALYNNGIGATFSPLAAQNTAIGFKALFNNTTGFANTANGWGALYFNTTGDKNTANGRGALYSNTTGESNTANGSGALYSNTTGYLNTANGWGALYYNTTGISNTANGGGALYFNTTGDRNTANGYNALYSNTTGYENTANGWGALFFNTTGYQNTANGRIALYSNTTGYSNTANGYSALSSNTTGYHNTANGTGALATNTTGSGNVALGFNAGFNANSSNKLYIENSQADSLNALIYGDFAADSLLLNAKTIIRNQLTVKQSGDLTGIELGYLTGKQTDAGKIQYGGFGGAANVLNIVGGGTAALGNDRAIKLWSEGGLRVRGAALPDADNFYALGNSTLRWSQVWAASGVVSSSDANLKTNITTSPYGLQQVLQMKPVQYNWKTNPTADLQIGFLAQDIKQIIPEAVVTPTNGDPMGMKYTELIPVLVKAIQEQQKQIDELKKENAAIKNKLGIEK